MWLVASGMAALVLALFRWLLTPAISTARLDADAFDDGADAGDVPPCPAESWVRTTPPTNKATRKQYLVIGTGFVGKRLVRCLLDRGETHVRAYDLAPASPFDDDEGVEYVSGDVASPQASQSQSKNQNGATSGFVMCFWYRIPAPCVLCPLGVQTKPRLESSIKKVLIGWLSLSHVRAT